MTENEISYLIRGAIYKVYNNIGPGLLESVYETALVYELRKIGLNVKSQLGLPFIYEELKMEVGFRIDIFVENKVIVEVKSVEHLAELHYKQLLTYLKLSEVKLGLLVNFNTSEINENIIRIVNPKDPIQYVLEFEERRSKKLEILDKYYK
jgi:GxxExxY protein